MQLSDNMNHCRKVILLWIVIVVGMTLSCRSLFAISEKTIEILKEAGGVRAPEDEAANEQGIKCASGKKSCEECCREIYPSP